jgi:hypothetical protein
VLIVAENGYCTAVLALLPAGTMIPAMATTAAAGPRSVLQKLSVQIDARGLMLCKVLTAMANDACMESAVLVTLAWKLTMQSHENDRLVA